MDAMTESRAMGAKPEYAYIDRLDHDGSPEDMPEVARELTMLRGATSSADRALNEVFTEFDVLLKRLQPVVDQRPTPPRDVPISEIAVQRAPEITTGLGGDIRSIYDHVGTLEAQLHTLGQRIRNLSATVRL